jgi:hypothetical protein
MESESHTTYLLAVIFVLGLVCFGRWVYLEAPDPPATEDYSQEAGAPPLQ